MKSDYVHVLTVSSEIEAQIIKGKLEMFNIDVTVWKKDGGIHSPEGNFPIPVIELYVKPENVKEANKIIHEVAE